MFLPRLSLPHKPKLLQLTSEQQEVSLGDVDEEEFDYSEDEEAVEENQTGDKPTLEDYSEGGEDLKFKEEQEDDRTAAECSSMAVSSYGHH